MENKYFYCYSKPLKDYFLKNGLRYVLKATHDKTHKQYWIFESCEDINKLLSKWRLKKQ
nr:MAG TPA: hypothetical protein [Caudoviricetes sp.]